MLQHEPLSTEHCLSEATRCASTRPSRRTAREARASTPPSATIWDDPPRVPCGSSPPQGSACGKVVSPHIDRVAKQLGGAYRAAPLAPHSSDTSRWCFFLPTLHPISILSVYPKAQSHLQRASSAVPCLRLLGASASIPTPHALGRVSSIAGTHQGFVSYVACSSDVAARSGPRFVN